MIHLKPMFYLAGWMVSAFVLAGCASHRADLRVACPNASVNTRPATIWLDTGAYSTTLFSAGARRLGLGSSVLSPPTPLSFEGQTLTAPLPIFHLPWAVRLTVLFKRSSVPDGVVGWPEIRDNILVFDADRHTVRSVPQLPREIAGWLKLKVVPGDWLFLEVPLTDGKTGTVEVDTGSFFGLQMSPAQWTAWQAAHRQSILPSTLGGVGSFGVHVFHTGWADEIRLGPLTLTDVVVENLPANQAAVIQRSDPGAQAAWCLGLRALNRLDLVVDAKNGFAYVHPRPPPGPPYPGVEHLAGRPVRTNAPASGRNWTVADNVRLRGDNLFLISGKHKSRQGDWAGALADFNQALAIDPQNAGAYSRRGVARQMAGDFSGALSDYDQVIALKPDASDWERLYRQTLLWRLGRPPEDFSKSLAICNGELTKPFALYLAGQVDEQALLTAVVVGDARLASQWRGLSFYYIGAMRLSQGNPAGARDSFRKCRAAGLKTYDEYNFAGAELGRLEPRQKAKP